MSQRLDALIVREYTDANGETKAAFTRVGTAFASKNGPGYTVVLEALPVPTLDREGRLQCRFLLREPQPRDGQPAQGRPQQQQRRPAPQQSSQRQAVDYGADDDIPF